MKYFIGLIILIFGIVMMADLAFKTRYTRKRLSKTKKQRKIFPYVSIF